MSQQPDDLSPAFPGQVTLLRSSKALPWHGLLVEQRYHPAGEYAYGGFPDHLLCLHQGPPSFLEHSRAGCAQRGMMLPGGIQIVPAGTACAWQHPTGTRFLALSLAPELVRQVAADLQRQRVELLPQFAIQDPRIEHICLALLAELAAGGSAGRLYGEGLATALAAHLIAAYSSAPRPLAAGAKGLPPALLRRIVSVIEDRLAKDLGLAELAREAGLSQSHFASLFRLSTGLSPHQYILQRRVERAQSLLRSTSLAIDEIATTVGFYDQSHLTRQMQRALGVTPKYLREHGEAGAPPSWQGRKMRRNIPQISALSKTNTPLPAIVSAKNT